MRDDDAFPFVMREPDIAPFVIRFDPPGGGAGGSEISVQYAGGSQSIVVPPNTPVSEIKLVLTPLAVGDRVVVPTKKGADGSLTAGKALLARR
jgi:hypothetical protein